MKKINTQKLKELDSFKRSATSRRTAKLKRIDDLQELISPKDDPEIKRSFKEDIKKKIEELKSIDDELMEINLEIDRNKGAIETYEKFLELLQKTPNIIRFSDNLEEIDYYVGKIFLNFTVDKKNVLAYQLESPFKELVENGIVKSNRSDWT